MTRLRVLSHTGAMSAVVLLVPEQGAIQNPRRIRYPVERGRLQFGQHLRFHSPFRAFTVPDHSCVE